jgi:hypothetical protein
MPRDLASALAPTLPSFLHTGQIALRRRFIDRSRPRRLSQGGCRLRLVPAHHVQPPGGLCLASDHRPMVEELRADMAAETLSDALLKAVKFTRWVLGLQKQGYKLAMVKDGQVEAIQLF